jgi:hypothetical protein
MWTAKWAYLLGLRRSAATILMSQVVGSTGPIARAPRRSLRIYASAASVGGRRCRSPTVRVGFTSGIVGMVQQENVDFITHLFLFAN